MCSASALYLKPRSFQSPFPISKALVIQSEKQAQLFEHWADWVHREKRNQGHEGVPGPGKQVLLVLLLLAVIS